MLSKKEIKDIQSLGLKKHRDETGLFVAEGPKIVAELAELIPAQIEGIYAVQDWIKERAPHIPHAKVQEISEIELERISSLQTPNKVLAVLKQSRSVEPTTAAFTLYLDAIQDPGNFGTIIRIADWFGIKNIVCGAGCADQYNPKVVQSTMASIARVNVYHDNAGDWLSRQNIPIYAATLEGRSVLEYSTVKEGVLLIGNESKGLRNELLERATEKLTIPRIGSAESLNAAVATGIILSHLLL